MSEAEQLYHDTAASMPDAEKSQMFGKPCYKVNGKAFVCFFKECMVFKLTGTDHTKALALEGSELFDPSGKGRAMKEWVQVTYANKASWKKFCKAAYEYVNS